MESATADRSRMFGSFSTFSVSIRRARSPGTITAGIRRRPTSFAARNRCWPSMMLYPFPSFRSTTTTGARNPTRATESTTRFTWASLAFRWCEMTSSFPIGRSAKVRSRRVDGSLKGKPASDTDWGDRAGTRLPPLDDPAHEGRLACVLGVVVDHAHESDAERDGRVPSFVHDPIQVGIGDALDVADRLLVDGVVIVDEQIAGVDRHCCDVVGPVRVPGIPQVERQTQALHPALRGPDLVGPGRSRDVIVLDAGQVPHQPRDRVGVVVEPNRQLPRRQPLDRAVHDGADPAEGVDEELSAGHMVSPLDIRARVSFNDANLAWRAPPCS